MDTFQLSNFKWEGQGVHNCEEIGLIPTLPCIFIARTELVN